MIKNKITIKYEGLLRILGETIYSDSRACIREIIQNANDSCVELQDIKNNINCSIRISIDKKNNSITVEDDGIGMNKYLLKEKLSIIGNEYKKHLKENLSIDSAKKVIGQFGIGILSAFSVTNQIRVYTRRYNETIGFLWECKTDSINYSIEEINKDIQGTIVELIINQKNHFLIDNALIEKVIKRYADFLSIPIFFENVDVPVNVMHFPWEYGFKDVEKFINHHFGSKSSFTISLTNIDNHLNGILFIPDPEKYIFQGTASIDVFVSRMFICNNENELLPSWARFFTGLIESHKLQPTVGRDALIQNEIYEEIKRTIRKVILLNISNLRINNPSLLLHITTGYNQVIKNDCLEDDDFFFIISDYIWFNSTNGTIFLKKYLQQTKDVIYYSDVKSDQLIDKDDNIIIFAYEKIDKDILKKYEKNNTGIRIEKFLTKRIVSTDNNGQWHLLLSRLEKLYKLPIHVANLQSMDIPIVISEISDRNIQSNDLKRIFDKGKYNNI